jgi:hypothetical protein
LGRKEGPFVVFGGVDVADIEVAKHGGENAYNYSLIVKVSRPVRELEEQGCRLLLELEVEVVQAELEL